MHYSYIRFPLQLHIPGRFAWLHASKTGPSSMNILFHLLPLSHVNRYVKQCPTNINIWVSYALLRAVVHTHFTANHTNMQTHIMKRSAAAVWIAGPDPGTRPNSSPLFLK